jgi:cyclopropane fatty-acyl-phospholipid synthase-like methyltransferase
MSRLDKAYVDEFWLERAKYADPRIATHYKHDDALQFDLALALQYVQKDSFVLDLGCGSGALINSLVEHCSYVEGVDKVAGLMRHCRTDLPGKLKCVESDVMDYKSDRKFDIVLLFGVANFLTKEEQRSLYSRIGTFLKPNGAFIAKHACGVTEEVFVDTFSEVVGSRYNARYPNLSDEISCLEENFDVKVHDVYPAYLNPWNDTHFYAFICRHRQSDCLSWRSRPGSAAVGS